MEEIHNSVVAQVPLDVWANVIILMVGQFVVSYNISYRIGNLNGIMYMYRKCNRQISSVLSITKRTHWPHSLFEERYNYMWEQVYCLYRNAIVLHSTSWDTFKTGAMDAFCMKRCATCFKLLSEYRHKTEIIVKWYRKQQQNRNQHFVQCIRCGEDDHYSGHPSFANVKREDLQYFPVSENRIMSLHQWGWKTDDPEPKPTHYLLQTIVNAIPEEKHGRQEDTDGPERKKPRIGISESNDE